MDAAESNKNNFERTGRPLDKPMIFELMLRGGGIVSHKKSCTHAHAHACR